MHSEPIEYKLEYTLFPKKQIPVIYLVYTRFRIDESIYQAYTRYIPCLNFVGFPDDHPWHWHSVTGTGRLAEAGRPVARRPARGRRIVAPSGSDAAAARAAAGAS